LIRFISAQPAVKYFTWQIEVMLNNFIEMGIDLTHVDVLCATQENEIIPQKEWLNLTRKYKARFFFYKDSREDKAYTASIKPFLLKMHYKKYPELEKETIFLHDADMLFTRKVPLGIFDRKGDENWYGSDCRSYLGHNYILSKGEDVLQLMCTVCDIDREILKTNERKTIGAQYIIKNVDWSFWERVEKNSVDLYYNVRQLNTNKKTENPNYHELQIWCSEMWTLLWEAWKLGKNTLIHPELSFCWGTSTEHEWNMNPIFHNAGVLDDSGGLFFKGDFVNELPYGKTMAIKENSASKKYWDFIQKVSKKTVLTR